MGLLPWQSERMSQDGALVTVSRQRYGGGDAGSPEIVRERIMRDYTQRGQVTPSYVTEFTTEAADKYLADALSEQSALSQSWQRDESALINAIENRGARLAQPETIEVKQANPLPLILAALIYLF